MSSLDALRLKMVKKFREIKWQGHVCGRWSLFENTKLIRELLPKIAAEYDLRTIADCGAGDLSWSSKIFWESQVEYKAYDLVMRHPDVKEFDITAATLSPHDLILCRYVLNHLPEELQEEALRRFKKSGSGYLLATYQIPRNNLELILGEPLLKVLEKTKIVNNQRCDVYYGLWRLK